MSHDFLEYLRELFSDLGPITTRAMFGGHGVYFDGRIVGIVIDEAVYLKTDDATRDAFEAAGCAPFVYESSGKSVAMSYWSVPEEAMDSSEAFLPWARRAHEAALRKPVGRVRKRRSDAARRR
ncbi:competence protein TfoX [Lysobacter helvus]|uniref:Competence protein TfoX n=2 Tax=Lysobacteraceae TaxID=32033 RepID=A0ABM7Q2B2_9GAMM|nr:MULTISPECIES: TfoX/Sxy family protein [Lysobacter]BCT91383.1 competence protein TfoX [Lysobacter caseinilyticus]BCT94536.1 competence protein TfoX [Lysobacter helvus]